LQVPVHAELQHTLFTQLPLEHHWPAAQACPLASGAAQLPVPSQ
jgi:hypothetical protein